MSKKDENQKLLQKKIVQHKAKIGIIGLGYVGLPLAMEFSKAGFDVTGIEIDKDKVRMVNRGESYIQDQAERVRGVGKKQ